MQYVLFDRGLDRVHNTLFANSIFTMLVVGSIITIMKITNQSFSNLEIIGIALLVFPWPVGKNIWSLFGGFNYQTRGNIYSLFGIFQIAEGDAFMISGINLYQVCGGEAMQIITLNLYQNGFYAAQQIAGVSFYQKSMAIMGDGASQLFGVRFFQICPEKPHNWFSIALTKWPYHRPEQDTMMRYQENFLLME